MVQQTEHSAVFFQDAMIGHKEVCIAPSWHSCWYFSSGQVQDGRYVMPSEMTIGPFVRQGMKPVTIQVHPLGDSPYETIDFLGLLPILFFAVLVFIKALYPRRFNQFLSASFSNQGQWQLLREWNPLNNGITYLYSFLYFVSFAMFIQVAAQSIGSSPVLFDPWWLDLLLLSAGVGLLVSGKYFTILFLAVVFNARASGERYLSTQITFSMISLLVLIPVILLIHFQPGMPSLIIGASLIGLTQLIRVIRSWRVGLTENSFGLQYLFLYLCALEIVPLLIVLKIFQILIRNNVIG